LVGVPRESVKPVAPLRSLLYLARCVGELLDRSAEEFREAAGRVLEKNAELSRRLA